MFYRLLALPLVVVACWCAVAFQAQESAPETVVRAFLSAIEKGDLQAAAAFVEGAKPSPTLAEFARSMTQTSMKIEVTDLKSVETGDEATVTFGLKVVENGRTQNPARQTLKLRRSEGQWKVVPERPSSSGTDGHEVANLAELIANPDATVGQAKQAAKATACLSNVKQLTTACFMFMSDYDDKMLLNTAKLKTKLMPYTKNESIFVCPESGKAYSFNDSLTGKRADNIKDPAGTVMVYEGAKGVLDFRHQGRAVVGFADGHCKLINREQAKSLIWK